MNLAVMVASLLVLLSSTPAAQRADGVVEQAYQYNREGMIAMSKARFEDAVEHFQKAAALVPDYGITRRGLRYTPNFMTAWAYEKLGRSEEACRYFRHFLDLAPGEWLEAEKADHANGFLARHCPAMQQRAIPDEEHAL